MFNIEKAKEKYNKIVEENSKENLWNHIDQNQSYENIKKIYSDPDQAYDAPVSEFKNIIYIEKTENPITIRLASDGLCSVNKIIKFSNSSQEAKLNYELIRKGMFECLIWPSYAQSINQMKGLKSTVDDRLDLTLVDIQTFYEIIDGESELSGLLINRICEKCKLARAYLNLMTFTWLCSFGDFDSFIKERKLEAFVNDTKGKFKAEQWTDIDKKKFYDKYFKELIIRTQKYRAQNNID